MRRFFLSFLLIIALSACATPPVDSLELPHSRAVMKKIYLSVQQEDNASHKKDFDAFLIAYHQQVFDLLNWLHTQPVVRGDNTHFLILEDASRNYVQCLLHDDDTQADCEISSGLWGPNPHIHLSRRARRFVIKNGFTIKTSPGNYQRYIDDAAGPQRLWDLSDLMLEMLYRAYGAKTGDVCAVFPMQAASQNAQ